LKHLPGPTENGYSKKHKGVGKPRKVKLVKETQEGLGISITVCGIPFLVRFLGKYFSQILGWQRTRRTNLNF
jgi:hypothetical protein